MPFPPTALPLDPEEFAYSQAILADHATSNDPTARHGGKKLRAAPLTDPRELLPHHHIDHTGATDASACDDHTRVLIGHTPDDTGLAP